ncbi:beta-N-acetylhexosaminidase [Motilibacter rhizosphaerae]|uniref:Beta-N-acetylhexosaminidase n=1 Tax=Motilibacter rhizosphaerae TaxID=598652 RepID=A0A4V2F4N9_9ACTN|nr:glycoside hydrolase family 3 protein [Motilibacter rhizosphaerae]RZS89979.1 beta-N-acetylhexosaminidase [Motilibacter rhizosphaerae]
MDSAELRRLVAACVMPGFTGSRVPGWVLRALDDGLAGICVYGHNLQAPGPQEAAAARVRAIAAELRAARPDVLVALDEEGGDVTRLEYLTGSSYPGNLALGRVDDVQLTRRVARAVAADLRAAGVNVDFAPSVDVNSDPRNPVIGVRSFGADPDLVARHGVELVLGLQESGVAAAAKHFPGHGATVADSHLALPVIDADEEEFRRRDLPPFAAVVAAGVELVMTSHVVFTALDPEPATLSRRLLVDLLRGELGFAGVIVTDALDMAGVRAAHGIADGGALSLAAGADLLLVGAEDGEQHLADLTSAVARRLADGSLPEERLVEAAERVGRLRARLATPPPPPPSDPAAGGEAAQQALLARGVRPLHAPAVVVEVRGEANMAVGQAKWSLAEPLAQLGLLGGLVTVTEDGVAGTLPEPGEERPVVVVVRDAYRSAWQRAAVAELLASCSATLVALGMPDDLQLTTGPALSTGGAARACTAAAARLLAGRAAP